VHSSCSRDDGDVLHNAMMEWSGVEWSGVE
jgi:hypothetical protein